MVLPFTALIRAELVRTLRQSGPFLGAMLIVALASLAILAAWPAEGHLLYAANLNAQITLFVTVFAWVFCATLIIPASGATAIVDDRTRGMSDYVQMTLISPAGYVIAKFVNVLGLFWAFAAVSVPVTATVFFTVGLEWGTFLCVTSLIASTSISLASAGLCSSVLCQKRISAIATAYIGALCVLGFPLFILIFFAYGLGASSLQATLEWTLPVVSPLVAVVEYPQGQIGPEVVAGACAMQLTLGFLLMSVTIFIMEARSRWRLCDPVQPMAISEKRRARFSGRTAGLSPYARPIRDEVNPVQARELRWDGLARPYVRKRVRQFSVGFMVAFLVFAFICSMEGSLDEALLWGVAAFLCGLMTLLVPWIMAGALAREYEMGTADMLRMSLLTNRELLEGKVRAGLTAMRPLILAYVGVTVFGIPLILDVKHKMSLLCTWTTSVAACGVAALALTLLASSVSRKTSAALPLAYLLVIFSFTGGYGIATAMHEGAHEVFGRQMVLSRDDPRIVSITRAAGVTSAASGFVLNIFRVGYDEREKHSFFTFYWFVSVAVTLVWSCAIAALAAWRFQRGPIRIRWLETEEAHFHSGSR